MADDTNRDANAMLHGHQGGNALPARRLSHTMHAVYAEALAEMVRCCKYGPRPVEEYEDTIWLLLEEFHRPMDVSKARRYEDLSAILHRNFLTRATP